MRSAPHDKSVGELVGQLGQQTSTLLHKEVELAKAELREKAQPAGKSAGMFGGAGLFGAGAFAAASAALIAALDTVVPTWLAALMVAVLYGAVSAALAFRGRDKLREAQPAAPQHTIDTIKDDIQWAKHPTTSATTSNAPAAR